MNVTAQDLELYARRARAHFAPLLQDVAEELALEIARYAGAKTHQLRPTTTLAVIQTWMESLDAVEWVMATQEELDAELPDELAAHPLTTCGDLVQHVAARRRARPPSP